MADTIRVLVATDNHVGYNERDPVRGDDSWKSFHEIMCMAKERDVDMVLLGGDLFHDNVPSRKSMYNVMRSLRLNCYGDKPCEVEILSDGSEHFDPTIGHANYEDSNINVAIPVFSIHGNHDDPSGDGHYAALDLLEMSGLINYFGRVPISDAIDVKPLMLQKGSTKLALYGISNVRDERIYRSFKDGQVTFQRPSVQQRDWYNIGVVHQNHHAHTATTYLPENFLPTFLDLVVWGHEHECLINPTLNPEMGFKVMQPGSSVATSLAPGEAGEKHVAILSITGKEMECETIRLKTVRPFVYKEIILGTDKTAKKIAERDNHRAALTNWLMDRVNELISEAEQQWRDAQEEEDEDEDEEPRPCPLPLIRLRVEHSSVDGIKFEVENPQRFSNRFTGKVANNHDVVQFHTRRRAITTGRLKASEELKELLNRPEMAETVKVSKLVSEFLNAQSLTILPQNYFGDAVTQYIEKDDKHAMDLFIDESLGKQIQHLVGLGQGEDDDDDEDGIIDMIEEFKTHKASMEAAFANGELKMRAGGKRKYKPKPDNWDTDEDGEWEDQAAALIRSENERDSDDDISVSDGTPKPTSTRGRGRGRGGRGAAASIRARGTTRKTTTSKAAVTKTPAAKGKGKSKKVIEESEEEDNDVIMLDDDDEEEDNAPDSDSQAMFFTDAKGKKGVTSSRGSWAGSVASTTVKPRTTKPAATTVRKTPSRAAAPRNAKQSILSFSNSQASVFANGRSQHVSDIEDDDDDDAFEPAPSAKRKR